MRKIKFQRITILIIIFIILFLILLIRLFQLQIVNGKKYENNFVLKIKKDIILPSSRGNIYDRNGIPLATNKLVNSVTLEDSEVYHTERERQLSLNGKIYKIIQIVKSQGDSVESILKIDVDQNGNYYYSVEGFWLERFKADVYGKLKIEDLNKKEKDATPEDIISFLTEKFCVFSQSGEKYTYSEKSKYGLPEQISNSDLLDVLNIRYALSLKTYQKYLPVTVARAVSDTTVAAIMENKADLCGVDIKQETVRVYAGGESCASILGYVGSISQEELEEKKDEHYTINSIVGKSGMEQYLDSVLQGKDGKKEVYVNNMGKVIQDLGNVQEPVSGEDVYLSVDINLQRKVYEILERRIADILIEHLINTKYFDKKQISDTTEIKIPIYDVYISLLNNGVVDIQQLKEENSELEKNLNQKMIERRKQILKEIETDLSDMALKYVDIPKEKQEYWDYIIENLEILDKESYDINDNLFKKWNKGELSLCEFFHESIEKQFVNLEIIDTDSTYLQKEEIYDLLVEYILKKLADNLQFEKIVNKYLILNDKISPREIIMLLYEQNFFDKNDEDFLKWETGIISTYDLMIQKLNKLEITPSDLALDPCSGSAVVIDTDTGKVLACVSYPGYDNNRLANSVDNDYYYKISNNASLPLYNRATQQLSAPGSTFKPITIIAGLEENVINVSSMINCNGIFDKVQPALKCWNHAGHGMVTSVASALQNSCNDYLCDVAYRLGMVDNQEYSDEQALNYLQSYAEMFDLDKKSGIELNESKPHVTDRYAIPSSIGQGTNNFSTVQLGRYVTTLANQGTSFQLSLIEKIGNVQTEPKILSTIDLDSETWDGVQTGMEWYAQNTGYFNELPISIAGKSGTAQETKDRPDHGLFIGYAPADNPEIAVAVRIVNGYTSGNAVKCAQDIFTNYFQIK